MKRILVIEDNENNMELTSFILEASGFSVDKAYRGKDGIEQARTVSPDAILLDIQLPDIDGIQVLTELRNDSRTAAIPVIAVTSYAMTGDSKKLLEAGCNGYIEKPIDPGDFIQQIESILSGSEQTVNVRHKHD